MRRRDILKAAALIPGLGFLAGASVPRETLPPLGEHWVPPSALDGMSTSATPTIDILKQLLTSHRERFGSDPCRLHLAEGGGKSFDCEVFCATGPPGDPAPREWGNPVTGTYVYEGDYPSSYAGPIPYTSRRYCGIPVIESTRGPASEGEHEGHHVTLYSDGILVTVYNRPTVW